MSQTCEIKNMVVDIDSTTGVRLENGEYVMGPICTSAPISVSCGDCGAELELENSGRTAHEVIESHLSEK